MDFKIKFPVEDKMYLNASIMQSKYCLTINDHIRGIEFLTSLMSTLIDEKH